MTTVYVLTKVLRIGSGLRFQFDNTGVFAHYNSAFDFAERLTGRLINWEKDNARKSGMSTRWFGALANDDAHFIVEEFEVVS